MSLPMLLCGREIHSTRWPTGFKGRAEWWCRQMRIKNWIDGVWVGEIDDCKCQLRWAYSDIWHGFICPFVNVRQPTRRHEMSFRHIFSLLHFQKRNQSQRTELNKHVVEISVEYGMVATPDILFSSNTMYVTTFHFVFTHHLQRVTSTTSVDATQRKTRTEIQTKSINLRSDLCVYIVS